MSLQSKKKDEEDIKNALKNYFTTFVGNKSTIQIRYRPPFIQTNPHDARGDAISLVLERMLQKNLPLFLAYVLAYNFVDLFANKLGTSSVPFTEDYNIIDSNLWSREVFDCLEDYIKELVDGVRDLPAMPDGQDWLLFSLCAKRNRKPKMEDRHIALPSLMLVEPGDIEAHRKDAFFAVFDGHHGAECATYASAHFVECLFEAMLCKNNVLDVMNDAFERIDKRITARCRKENIKSGTTAACVYIKAKTAYLTWCGDSSIGVLHGNVVKTLSLAHKPEDPEERKRIEAAGGMVVEVNGVSRLNGVLNLSRSLGDIGAKPMISPEPDAREYPLTDDDYALFISSDGVWDILDEEAVYNSVRTFVMNHPMEDHHLMAQYITSKAKEAGAADNLTLIVVYLKPLKEIWEKEWA